ncbi:antitoxin VapB family protein [Halalkalicoccus sp. NIPERK01]|uniref:DUF7557 family protein n=1 Tax=Halalkalicoccus sp. NIPERK01 TaxID=3053469 RepID=UPI00256EF627|nr:antitoxin VapB family protein [Halalkalicoccus sp. NIPERK01]MDL5362223.1 antitoxin VapB family protein [Halalkalicoccus sp. NIPERK01]
MGSTSIRVSERTKSQLALLKREGESFDDVIARLAKREGKWTGFGVLADDGRDTREGLQRVREEIRDGLYSDLEGMEDR